MVDSLFLIFQAIILSAIAAVGFAMVFNVPKEYLKYCGLLGAVGNGIRTTLMTSGLGIEWSSLAAAISIGFVAIYIARKKRIYPKIISIAAAVPMFPGLHAYAAIIALIKIAHVGYTEALFAEMITEALRTFFVVGSLAIGLTIPGVWLPQQKRRL